MIRCKRIQNMKWTFDSISRDIKRYAENADSIRRHLRGKISSYDQIGDRIGKITNRMELQANDFTNMGNKAVAIAKLYEQSEKKIVGEKPDLGWLEAVGDALGEVPFISALGISTVVSWAGQDGLGAGDILLDVGDWATSAGGSIYDHLTDDWSVADWFGMVATDYTDDFIGNIKVAAKESVDFMEKENWGKALGIAGAALSFVSSAKDNIEEYQKGEIGWGRAVAETVGEFAVDWGVGIGMTALAATLLPVGAPAVAVGAVAAVGAWALDEVFQAACGKSAAEATSDFILDTGEAAINGIKSAASSLANWWRGIGQAAVPAY